MYIPFTYCVRRARCLLCDAPATLTCVFEPYEGLAHLVGEPPGKRRVIIYPLCLRCADAPDTTAKVEARLAFEFGGGQPGCVN